MHNLKVYLNIGKCENTRYRFEKKDYVKDITEIAHLDSYILVMDSLMGYVIDDILDVEGVEDITDCMYIVNENALEYLKEIIAEPKYFIEDIEHFGNRKIEDVALELDKLKNCIQLIESEIKKGNNCILTFKY